VTDHIKLQRVDAMGSEYEADDRRCSPTSRPQANGAALWEKTVLVRDKQRAAISALGIIKSVTTYANVVAVHN